MTSTKNCLDKVQRLGECLREADAVIVGAGAGLSTLAGFTYTGKRFRDNFADFIDKYGFRDMYSGGFYPFESLEEHWAYWSRYIYINRYKDSDNGTYAWLYELVKDKDYFVLTTNVDHQFQKAGFDKHRLFYTQGDYGLFQCSKPCRAETFDNEEIIKSMVTAQGYTVEPDGTLAPPEAPKMTVTTELVPHCPHCGRPMSMNLRADSTFVEDEGWHIAAERYSEFLRRHRGLKVLFLELGVGMNTPVIIKFVFQDAVRKNKSANYVCVNLFEAAAPVDIWDRSICIDADCSKVIKDLLAVMNKNK